MFRVESLLATRRIARRRKCDAGVSIHGTARQEGRASDVRERRTKKARSSAMAALASGTSASMTRCQVKAGPRTTAVDPRQRRKPMGLFTKDIKNMDDLFQHTLADIYYAEQQIVKALPDMAEKASDQKLKEGFQTHLRESEMHVRRLDQVFQKLGVKAKGVDCPAIDGIIEEANDVAGEVSDKSVLDAALIAAAQAVEHYEMTRYGTLIAWASELGHKDVAGLLRQTLEEEKATDQKLTAMAEAKVNRKAA
jgi:ferritin-like metal-binding protein YciE